jgi:hypothetical protein
MECALRYCVWEDVLFTVLQPVEDALRDGIEGGFRDLEAASHVGNVSG